MPERAPLARVVHGHDALYDLPPAEFVAARNSLAGRLKAGGDAAAAAAVKALARPSVAAFAVNRLVRRAPALYRALLEAAAGLRRAQQAGAANALRAALQGRQQALAAAVQGAVEELRQAGQKPTPALEERITRTLLALAAHGAQPPAGIVPGRLVQELEAPGFDAQSDLVLPEPAPRAPALEPPTAVEAPGPPADPRASAQAPAGPDAALQQHLAEHAQRRRALEAAWLEAGARHAEAAALATERAAQAQALRARAVELAQQAAAAQQAWQAAEAAAGEARERERRAGEQLARCAAERERAADGTDPPGA